MTSPSLTQCSPAGQVCGHGVSNPGRSWGHASGAPALTYHCSPRTQKGTWHTRAPVTEENESDSDRERFLTTLRLARGFHTIFCYFWRPV